MAFREEAYRRGGLLKKQNEKDIFYSFISLLPHTLRIQHTILRVKYINSTDSFTPNYIKINMQTFLS